MVMRVCIFNGIWDGKLNVNKFVSVGRSGGGVLAS